MLKPESSERQIPVTGLVKDILDGANESEIMEKYGLSVNGLKSALIKLLDSKTISPFTLSQWASLFCETPIIEDIPLFKRVFLDFYVPVYDAEDPTKKGTVINVSETGVGFSGIRAQVNDIRTFVIPVKSNHLTFVAKCRWFEEHYASIDDFGGFEIVKIVKGNWEDFCQKILAKKERGTGKEHRALVPQEPWLEQKPPSPQGVYPQQRVDEMRWTLNEEPAEAHQETLQSEGPDAVSVEPGPPEMGPEAEPPSLAFVQRCIESDDFIRLFTTSRQHLAFVINPTSFAEITPETRLEMLDKVKSKNGQMIAVLNQKAEAFRLAIENSAWLAVER
jgi:hypothetical protein